MNRLTDRERKREERRGRRERRKREGERESERERERCGRNVVECERWRDAVEKKKEGIRWLKSLS